MTQQNKSGKLNKNKITAYLKYALVAILLGCFLAFGILTGLVAAYVKDEPVRSAKEIQNKIATNNLTGFAYFSNKDEEGNYQQIGALRADEDRRLIQYDEMSQDFIEAVVAIEDREFWDHNGVNFISTGRALFRQLLNLEVERGGSTITQQLAKNTFLSFEKTNERKAKEIFLALRIDRVMSKKDIFAAYVNKNPYGKAANLNNVYGIQAAAKGYFNKDSKDLNLAESAYLAGLPQRPTAYSAFDSNGFNEEKYQLAIDRQHVVLDSMLEENYISKKEYNEAIAYDIKAAFDYTLVDKKANNEHPYLIMEVENRAAEIIVEKSGAKKGSEEYTTSLENAKLELLTGGYKVYTTVDKNVYEAMNSVANNPENFSAPKTYNFKQTDGSTVKIQNALEEVGATLIQNKTGAILGFVGGRDFEKSQVNHSNFRGTSDRQPGSSIKPLLDYGPALELGYVQPGTPIDDIPLDPSLNWEPDNWNRKYNGRLTARTALNWSYNIPAVKVYSMVGTDLGYEYYTKLGLKAKESFFKQAGLTSAIGAIETSPERMTNAYATFPNGGTYIESYLIESIVDHDGNVIYEHNSQPEVVFSEQTAYLMTDMMRTVISSGTGGTVRRYVDSKIDIAGKTGTTNFDKDAWFIGYSTEVTLGVWVGYDYPVTLPDSAIASKTWGRIFAEVLKVKPEIAPVDSKFRVPNDLVRMEVSSTSGKLPSDLTREAGYLVTDWFNKKYIPTEIDDSLERARVVYYNNERYIAKEETPDDMVQTGIFFKREPYVVPSRGADDEYTKSRPVDYEKELPSQVDSRISTGTPSSPSLLVLKMQADKNVLSWDKNTNQNIVGYRIYRYSLIDSGFKYINTVIQKNTTPERVYYEDRSGNFLYYVVAVDINGLESNPSNYVGNLNGFTPDGTGTSGESNPVLVPSVPGNISYVHAPSTDFVVLAWNDNPANESVTSYNVYYSTTKNGTYTLLSTVNDTLYTHNNIGEQKNLYYYITAVNQLGESQPSLIIEVK